jgi:hypothetical protein
VLHFVSFTKVSDMKKEEVPQDGDNLHQGSFKQIFYAVDPNGSYTSVTSVGWEPENIALEQAWEHVETRVAQMQEAVHAGQLSPIAFYMERTLLDLPLLARKIGKFQWQVKRHMKPSVFAKLSSGIMEKYASIFGITSDQLKQGILLPFERPTK